MCIYICVCVFVDTYIHVYIYIYIYIYMHVCIHMCRQTPSLPPAQKRLASGRGQTSGSMLGSFQIYVHGCVCMNRVNP